MLLKEWTETYRAIQEATQSSGVTLDAWTKLRDWSRDPGLPGLPDLIKLFKSEWGRRQVSRQLFGSGTGKPDDEAAPRLLAEVLAEVRRQAAPAAPPRSGEVVLNGIRVRKRETATEGAE